MAISLFLQYCMLLSGGATHENTTQEPVRLLLYLILVFGAEAGSRRMQLRAD